MWQRVAIIAGLGFVAGLVIGTIVAMGVFGRATVSNVQDRGQLILPAVQTVSTDTGNGVAEAPPAKVNTATPTKPKASSNTQTNSNSSTPPSSSPPIADSDLGCGLSELEKYNIETWIKKTNRNIYGDPADTVYAGGNPLFNERTGQTTERCQYILDNHPTKPWNS